MPSILVIDDDDLVLRTVQRALKLYGHHVMVARGGAEGMQLARRHRPDLIVLDVVMPGLNGYQVCRQIRQDPMLEDLPILFLTAKGKVEDRIEGFKAGGDDYLAKPFDMQELRLRMRNVLRRAGYKSLVNAVTNLPEGEPVRERLLEMLRGEDWGLVLAGLRGLHHFRDRYGFVASDDVARATGIMVASAARRAGQPEVFVGHLDTADFILVTTADCAADMAAQVEEYLAAAVPQFYPAVDREKWRQKKDPDQLAYQMTVLTARDGACRSLDDLRTRLHGHQPPTPDSQLPTANP